MIEKDSFDIEFSNLDFDSTNASKSKKDEENNNSKIKDYDRPILGLDTELDSNEFQSNIVEPLLTPEDIYDDVIYPSLRKSNFLAEVNLPKSNLIKKSEVKNKNVLEPNEFKTALAKDLNIREQDWAEIAQEISQTDLLDDNFRDFIELPKISGDERNLIGKRLIPANKISQVDKKVEISDRDLPDDIDHRTSIEINRDEKGDIESITVYCKCGEVTDIKFDYDDSSNSEETEYFHSSGTIDNLKLEQLRPGNSK
ncbi:hypothetical protein MASR1M45_03710 [Candidatus Kapaibacterium sp.]